ncbi:MAG: carboxymuconolactone decarboxylase family protein, partial [Fretibacterium sp.]|nr:carboxymuconolactone decarboxylase family protein [Fretibacterium sp.]
MSNMRIASEFQQTDPEFAAFFDSFALNEVPRQSKLDERTRFMAILATLLGCQGLDEFRAILPAALDNGVTPVEAKEIIYQATAYLGIGRVRPFLTAANDV